MEETAISARLKFFGGDTGALAPFLLFLSGVAWLGLSGAPDERGFWAILVAALCLGLLLSRDRHAYADAVIWGMSHHIVMLMILSWMLAGVLSALLNAGGFIEALVWLAGVSGVSHGGYCVAAFLICCAVSTATGTSLGTILICSPLLYPAGGSLGADPGVLLGAILGGATFGDNVSPVSDTTIASAASQEAEMGRVVLSRLRYALPAAAVAMVGFGLFGSNGGETGTVVSVSGNPAALPLLAVPAFIVFLLLRRRHLVEGLLLGGLVAVVLELLLGLISPAELLFIDPAQFGARGLIVDGIDRAVGVSVFTLLLMGLVAGLEGSGMLDRLVSFASRRTRSQRGAETWLFGVVSGAVLLTTHATVAILMAGKFASSVGKQFGIDRYRRANLLDVTVCTYPFLLPYFIPTILAASTTQAGVEAGMPRIPVFEAGLWNVYSWMLLFMVLVSILTGWGRTKPSVSKE